MERSTARKAAPYVIGLLIVGGLALATPKSWYSQDALDKENGIGNYAGLLTAAQRAQVDRAIPRLESFVAHDRGGPFPHGVSVRYLRDRDFTAKVEHIGLDSPEGISAAQVAVGTGLSAHQTSTHLRHLNVSDIVGLYGQHRVLMKGNTLDLEHTDILVHELTHAWDGDALLRANPHGLTHVTPDQHNAIVAVVEGDATAVQADYLDSIGPTIGCQVMEELAIPFTSVCRKLHYSNGLSRINPGDIDAATEAYTRFPYTIGALFIRALRAHGGEQAVDQALRHPPVDTAQIIEPSLYFHGIGPRAVPAPAVRRPLGPSASLGELGISVTLTHGGFGLGSKGYLTGWAGDRYVENQLAGRRCLHDDLELRSPAVTAAAMRRFDAWMHQGSGRSARRAGSTTIEFTSCQ